MWMILNLTTGGGVAASTRSPGNHLLLIENQPDDESIKRTSTTPMTTGLITTARVSPDAQTPGLGITRVTGIHTRAARVFRFVARRPRPGSAGRSGIN